MCEKKLTFDDIRKIADNVITKTAGATKDEITCYKIGVLRLANALLEEILHGKKRHRQKEKKQ